MQKKNEVNIRVQPSARNKLVNKVFVIWRRNTFLPVGQPITAQDLVHLARSRS